MTWYYSFLHASSTTTPKGISSTTNQFSIIALQTFQQYLNEKLEVPKMVNQELFLQLTIEVQNMQDLLETKYYCIHFYWASVLNPKLFSCIHL